MKKGKLLTYFLIPILSVYLIICNLSIISYADVSEDFKAQSYSGNWSYNHNYGGLGKYFVIQDTTGLTQCTSLAPFYYYTNDNITFKSISGNNIIALVLNKAIGLVLSPELLQSFYNKFYTAINVTDPNGHLQNGIYDSNDNFYGYALNDITGCYFDGIGTGNINIPSYVTNNIKIVADNNLDFTPPYINYHSVSANNVINNYVVNNSYGITSEERTRFLSFVSSHNYALWRPIFLYNSNVYVFDSNYTNNNNKVIYYRDDAAYYIAESDNSYNTFCSYNSISKENFDLYFGELARGNYIRLYQYDSEYNKLTTINRYNLYTDTTDSVGTTGSNQRYLTIGDNGGMNTCFNGNITIYKNLSILLSLEDKSYVPSYFTTNKYFNYNTSQDNSVSTTTQQIDNSITTNETIYNTSENDYSQYIDNSVIDNSSVINNTTNIVNNYYGSSSGEGGEGGGGSDNDSVLDTLLQGLLSFFNAIGRVLATVITGLLDMFTTVLDAIASLTTDLTGITDFFGSLFSWMPDPIPQVIGIGISVCVLCAVIRFIRG